MADIAPARPRTWSEALAVYATRRTGAMLVLGFACGLPFWLIFDTLSAWLRQAGLSLAIISFFGLSTLAYAFKFLWAPVIDRTHVPGLTKRLGHRRSWMVVAQAAVVVGLVLVSLSDPLANLPLMATFAVLTGFAGATQDIVVDAWRIEVAPESEQGAMAAAYQWGHRIAFLTSGAVPLILADRYDWSVSYGVMAAIMAVAMVGALFAPREAAHAVRPIPRVEGRHRPVTDGIEWAIRLLLLVFGGILVGSGLSARDALLLAALPPAAAGAFDALWTARGSGIFVQFPVIVAGFALIVCAAVPLPRRRSQPGVFLAHAFGDPLSEFFRRFGRAAASILLLICFYRISQFVLTIMNPFYIDLGFTLTQVAEVRKLYGVIMDAVGVFIGGYAIARFGLMRCLVVGAAAAPLSNLAFAWLATIGPSIPAFMVCLGLNNIAQNFAGTCLIAYMSSLTSAGFTATQYALFSSLYALPDKFIMTQSGRIVEGVAASVDRGGLFAPLKALVAHTAPETYAAGAARAGVAPEALGTGYVAFFVYTCVIGLAVVPLAIAVTRRHTRSKA